jgi:large subunit ribosomal protein L23
MTLSKDPSSPKRPISRKRKAIRSPFEVDKRANRVEIARAIEKIFSVKVAKTRTVHVKGKIKRRGRILGKRKDWKKAIVTLMPGERIDFFEGV